MRQPDDQDGAGLRWSSRCKETEHRRWTAMVIACARVLQSWRPRSECGRRDKNLKIQVLLQDARDRMYMHIHTCTFYASGQWRRGVVCVCACIYRLYAYVQGDTKATYKSSSTTSIPSHDQVLRRTTTTLPKKSEAIQATRTMQVRLR
jgi:hypothetical protein